MEQYLEAIKFSNDLFTYIGHKLKIPMGDFLCPAGYYQNKRFNEAIGEAVWNLTQLGDTIIDMSFEIEEVEDSGVENFAKLALQAVVEYFPKGYGHSEFISYCAVVVGTAINLFSRKKLNNFSEEVFDVASGLIATVLMGHVIVSWFDGSDKTWRELTEVAEKYLASHFAC